MNTGHFDVAVMRFYNTVLCERMNDFFKIRSAHLRDTALARDLRIATTKLTEKLDTGLR